jgi:hypothetical protein
MRGRLSLEYQVTKVTVSPPVAEDGDEILYPRDDIQEGAKKLYTESKVNDISNKINELLNQAYEANIGAFSNELAAAINIVRGDSDLLNTYLGNDTEYKLPTLSEGITALWDNREGLIDNSTKNIYTEVATIAPYKFINSNIEEISANNVQEIGDHAFEGCASLNSISFNLLETVGERAFYHSSLTGTIELPKVKTINKEAFYQHTASGEGISTLKLSNSAFDSGESLTLYDRALADNSGSLATSDSIFRWIDVDDYHYIGIVATKPNDEDTTIEVSDTVIYSDNPQTFDVREGLIVFAEDENKPYVFEGGSWIYYVPKNTVNFGNAENEVYHSTRIRDIGFKVGSSTSQFANAIFRGSRALFLILDGEELNPINSFWEAAELRTVLTTDINGDLTDELPYTSLYWGFYRCANLSSINLIHLETIEENALRETGLKTIFLPALVNFGRWSNWQGFASSQRLESAILGNGTNQLTIKGTHHFVDCINLISVALNYTAVPALSDNSQTMQTLFANSPIYWYLGTTTTAISVGDNAGDVVIDGVTKQTVNNNIVSYNGEDYQRVNGKWALWGSGQNKTPRILVPSNLIDSYKADVKWGTLSPEIWQAIE